MLLVDVDLSILAVRPLAHLTLCHSATSCLMRTQIIRTDLFV